MGVIEQWLSDATGENQQIQVKSNSISLGTSPLVTSMISFEIATQIAIVFAEWGDIATVIYIKF